MVLPLIPILAIGATAGGMGWLAGKSGGGSGVDLLSGFEIGTTKKSTQITDSRQYTTTSTYSPTINRSFDIQYNIASEGSNISTKKESSISQTPTTSPVVTPQLITIPTTMQGAGEMGGAGGSGAGSFDIMTPTVLVGLGVGAYFLFFKDKNRGKKK